MLRETRWVLLTLYNVVLNFAAVLPLLSMGGWDDDKQAIGLVVSLEFSAGGIILANLLPKVLSTWRHNRLSASQSASKSSIHGGKLSTEGSSHGLVRLDVSPRAAGQGPTSSGTPVSKQLQQAVKKGVKKKLLDEVEIKKTHHNHQTKEKDESPTLTALSRPLAFSADPNAERGENGVDDSQYGRESSISSRVDFRGGNNDSFILMEKQERPESPSHMSIHKFMDDPEIAGTPEIKRAQPSEPTIVEENDEQAKEGTTPRPGPQSYRFNLKIPVADVGSLSKSGTPLSTSVSGSSPMWKVTPPGGTHTLGERSPSGQEPSGKKSSEKQETESVPEGGATETEIEADQDENMEVY
jgi:hypothetical protein